jgi:hypothetical protein
MPQTKGRALLWIVLLGLCGCSQAQFVVVENDHGIVSIPRNTNAWPTYYRNSADELLREKFPQGVVIDREEAKVVGEDVQHGHATSLTMLGMRIDRETEHTRPITEWYIYFHAIGSPAPPVLVSPPPLPAPVGDPPLPDQPVPVAR